MNTISVYYLSVEGCLLETVIFSSEEEAKKYAEVHQYYDYFILERKVTMEKDMKFTTAGEWVKDSQPPKTPQEIFDYRLKWRPGYQVIVHSDLRDHAKDWCKINVEKHKYIIKNWTHIYAFTYCFEQKEIAYQFEKEFSSWVNKGID
jgi:hypothetical protein